MGYTHYWYLNETGNQTKYRQGFDAVRDFLAQREARGAPIETVVTDDGELVMNGKPGCESLVLMLQLDRARWSGIGPQGWSFNFCKTRHEEYDRYVTAALLILKHYLGDDVRLSSDGDEVDWEAGLKLAREYLDKPDLSVQFDPSPH